MAENKTKPSEASVSSFLNSIEHSTRRADGWELHKLISEITGWPAVLWGPSMVGYGKYHYKYESGHEGDSFRIGFSPRKSSLSIYLMPGVSVFPEELNLLGKHKIGKSCLYINKLADINKDILHTLIEKSVQRMEQLYPVSK